MRGAGALSDRQERDLVADRADSDALSGIQLCGEHPEKSPLLSEIGSSILSQNLQHF